MIIQQKLGNLANFKDNGRVIDRLGIEWYETRKRILHKRTGAGRDVVLKFLRESQRLRQDDVLYADEHTLIVVEIMACDAIVLRPSSMFEMAFICYEIGNKHLPLFFEQQAVLIPFEAPVYRMLETSGFNPVVEKRKLLQPLRTTVEPHEHSRGGGILSRIIQLTTPPPNA